MRKSLALSLMALVFITANAFALGEARITGKILDSTTGEPIPNATINVVSTEGKNFKANFTVKKDGSYAVFLLDGTIKYRFTYAAPGYTPYEEVMKLKLGEPNTKDVKLVKGDAAAAGGAVPQQQAKADPAVTAYNEGAAFANEGKDAEAIAKFTEAVTLKPELTAGWMALAKTQLRSKAYDKAIEAANKALEFDNEDTDMWGVLYESYKATGQKDKAAEAKKKMPANAGMLFNDAAKAINAGKDGDAEPLLKQAISADASFSQAYYELGMLYVRAGKNADAKTNLEKYLELDPNGKDAATAKEMLNYVK